MNIKNSLMTNNAMEKDEFIKNISNALDLPDPSKLTMETLLEDTEGYGSLSALMVILMLDEDYNVTITGNDLRNVNTIGDLYNYVKSNK